MTNVNNKIEVVSFHDLLTVEGKFCTVNRNFRVIYFDKHVLQHPTTFFLQIHFVELGRIVDVTPPFSILRMPYSLN